MDIDFSLEVKHTWVHERPYKVTLTRGASGQYRWEIEVRADSIMGVIEATEDIDKRLWQEYAPLEPTDQE